MVVNIFCDASIDTEKRVACAGCCIVYKDRLSINYGYSKHIIQHNATNNSAEILAIWYGVNEALRIRKQMPNVNIVFNLFSDSKISLYGLRDWIQNWMTNAKDGILISSSGQPVMNQQRFIDTYNLIVENKLYINFYHQRGHVNERVSLDQARAQFIKANKRTPESLGLNIDIISEYNNSIDKSTRKALTDYLLSGEIPEFTEIEGIHPFEYTIRSELCHQYNRYIGKR